MRYTVEVNIDTAVGCYRFEYDTEEEAKAIIRALSQDIGNDGVDCVRIRDTVIRTDVIQSAHLLSSQDSV